MFQLSEYNFTSSDLKMHALEKVAIERRKRRNSLSVSDLSESSDLSSECDNVALKKKKKSGSIAPDRKRAKKPINILDNMNVAFPIRKVFEIAFLTKLSVIRFQ